MSHDLAELRKTAAAHYLDGPERDRAWSRYHHALQAMYEAGELIPNLQSPVSVWVEKVRKMSAYDIAKLIVAKEIEIARLQQQPPGHHGHYEGSQLKVPPMDADTRAKLLAEIAAVKTHHAHGTVELKPMDAASEAALQGFETPAVDRFVPSCKYAAEGYPEAYAFKHPNGEYVRFTDYAAMRALAEQATDLIEGNTVGIDWKRGCSNFLAAAHAALGRKPKGRKA